MAVKSEHIPKATIARLATYIQVLSEFKREGTDVVSSERLAEACSVNSSQIRKDLAYFGEFGVRGLFLGVPCVLGGRGLEQVCDINLDDAERAAFEHSASRVRALVDDLARLGL